MKKFLFKLLIDIEFVEDVRFSTFERDYVYHYNRRVPISETIRFSPSKIEIEGTRLEEKVEKEFLISRKSRIYKECISALLFIYYKFGPFVIKKISINDYEVETFSQKFKETVPVKLSDEVLDKLFDYKDESVYIPLMHLTEGLNYPNYKLEHCWKAFNYIYNRVCNSQDDKNGYSEIVKIMEEYENHFLYIFEEAKTIIASGNIDMGRAVSYFCKNNLGQTENIKSFRDIFEISQILDKGLLEWIETIFNEIYFKNKEDFEKNSSTGQYELDTTKDYNAVRKSISKNIKKSQLSDSDYLKFILNYTFYLRNKSMHGVFQTPSFLFDTEHTSELVRYGDLLSNLCFSLLNNDVYSFRESSK